MLFVMKVTSHLQHIWTKTVSLYLLPPPPFIGVGSVWMNNLYSFIYCFKGIKYYN